MQLDRASGILLHISSLPGPHGIGDAGPAAYRFVDYLAAAGQCVWQVLPLVPVGHGDSPYSSPSTFAGNTLFISPDKLVEAGLLEHHEIPAADDLPTDSIDFGRVHRHKRAILEAAHRRFRHGSDTALIDRFDRFREEQSFWLRDFALFMALKKKFGPGAWTDWPTPLAQREESALNEAREELRDEIDLQEFAQFIFDEQWQALLQYARQRKVRIFGDLPIYVAHDSSDVWAHPELFHLHADGRPSVVAGVPPDYFSETGQRWGNPIYRWDEMERNDFRWWLQRFDRCFQMVDILRIDHFRGFQAYWEIPASEPTAVNGRWVLAPGAALFRALETRRGALPIVAEDLGLITPEVTALMRELGFPGMAVLQFAFGGGSDSTYLPHNFIEDLVAYTGTHDNDTMIGWWESRRNAAEGSHERKEYDFARQYFDVGDETDVHWDLIRWLMASVARLVVFPVQDVLGMGTEARMNVPGQVEANWRWRLDREEELSATAERLRRMADVYARL